MQNNHRKCWRRSCQALYYHACTIPSGCPQRRTWYYHARTTTTNAPRTMDSDFHYIINECNKFHLTRLDFLSLQKDTYIPIQFFINNFSTYNNNKKSKDIIVYNTNIRIMYRNNNVSQDFLPIQ